MTDYEYGRAAVALGTSTTLGKTPCCIGGARRALVYGNGGVFSHAAVVVLEAAHG